MSKSKLASPLSCKESAAQYQDSDWRHLIHFQVAGVILKQSSHRYLYTGEIHWKTADGVYIVLAFSSIRKWKMRIPIGNRKETDMTRSRASADLHIDNGTLYLIRAVFSVLACLLHNKDTYIVKVIYASKHDICNLIQEVLVWSESGPNSDSIRWLVFYLLFPVPSKTIMGHDVLKGAYSPSCRCHTKRRIGLCGCTNPPFGMTQGCPQAIAHSDCAIYCRQSAESNSEKSVSYQKKDGRGHAHLSFFWYYHD